MTHAELLVELRGIEGLVDVTRGQGARSNFHLRNLHFHQTSDGEVYADVRVGGGPSADFEPVWAVAVSGACVVVPLPIARQFIDARPADRCRPGDAEPRRTSR